MSIRSSLIVTALCLCLAACAPTTQRMKTSSIEVQREQEIQRELSIKKHLKYQARLDKVAFPILKSASEFCPDDIDNKLGITFGNVYNWEKEYRAAASRALGVDDTLSIISVTPGSAASNAGLLTGDKLLTLNGAPVTSGKKALKSFAKNLNKAFKTSNSINLQVQRDGDVIDIRFTADKVCNFPVVLSQGDEVNAYADGEKIIITKGMMRFAEEDNELALVIAHELGHNVMNHLDKKKTNFLLGSIFDIAAAAYGINTQSAFGNLAGSAYSQDYEAEADYVGIYYLYHAGYEIDNAANFWREMAAEHPGNIKKNHTSSHPATSERFVEINATVKQVYTKVAAGMTVAPDLKSDKK